MYRYELEVVKIDPIHRLELYQAVLATFEREQPLDEAAALRVIVDYISVVDYVPEDNTETMYGINLITVDKDGYNEYENIVSVNI